MTEFKSFAEYVSINPDRAKIIQDIYSYRILCGLNHDLFFDSRLYNQLKSGLSTDDYFQDQGYQLYEKEVQQNQIQYRSASDAELQQNVKSEITKLKKEFQDWQKDNPEVYTRCQNICETILNGNLESFNKDNLIESIVASIHQIPGITLAYQIHLNKIKLKSS